MNKDIIERFWSKVNKDTGTDCWEWEGASLSAGYGTLTIGSRTDGSRDILLAHRMSYEIHKGDIPEGNVVMHSCDNPRCVNSAHLSVGTYKDNMQDCILKGRFRSGVNRGENNGSSKLTEDEVLCIRSESDDGASRASLGRKYGVSETLIRFIVYRRIWKHI